MAPLGTVRHLGPVFGVSAAGMVGPWLAAATPLAQDVPAWVLVIGSAAAPVMTWVALVLLRGTGHYLQGGTKQLGRYLANVRGPRTGGALPPPVVDDKQGKPKG